MIEMAEVQDEGRTWRKRHRVPGLSVAVSLVLFSAVLGGSAHAGQQTPYAHFPLYKDVSGNGPFATLVEGQLPNGSRWGAWASRVGRGRQGFERPCLSLARITRGGEYRDAHVCGKLVPTGESKSVPVYVSINRSYQTKPNGPFHGESVLGLSFRPGVRSAVLKYSKGGQVQRRTHLFNSKQQRKTKLPPFRYIALALQDDVCVKTVIGYSKEGAQLFTAETGLCF